MAFNEHPSTYDQRQKFGAPGKWSRVFVLNNTSASFTGSDFGAGGVIVGEASTTGHADLMDGGRVNLAHLVVGTTYDFSVKHIACNAKTVYVLQKNPKVS